MTENVIVIGAGGFGRETLDVIEAAIDAGAPFHLDGVVDSAPRSVDLQRLADRNIEYLGTEEQWLLRSRTDAHFIIAIGNPAVRQKVGARLAAVGLHAATIIHPRAVIGSHARVGEGVVVASGAQVSTNVMLGNHVHLNPGCIVGHDAVLEDYVSVNPGAILSGSTAVRRGALIGAGAIVLQSLTVGEGAIVGAGACVTRDVAPRDTVVGVPARGANAARSKGQQ